MIDRRHIGTESRPFSVKVDEGLLRLFHKSVGETGPVYRDISAAESAGFDGIPVPPTYPYCLSLQGGDPLADLAELGISHGQILHGEQSFTYHQDIYVGDTITFSSRVADIYEKKNGALEFVVRDTILRNQHDEIVCEMRGVIAVLNSP